MAKRIGPQMKRIQALVAAFPGQAMMYYATQVSPHPTPSKNWSLGYAPVHRAIDAGLVATKPGPRNSVRLYPLTPPAPAR